MRSSVVVVMLLSLTVARPVASSAQDTDEALRADVESLLRGDSIDATLFALPERFFEHVMLLLPELQREDQEILAVAIEQAFAADALREELVGSVAAEASPELVGALVASRRTGPEAEVAELVGGYRPERSFDAFVADLGTPGPRLQRMVELAEARGEGDFELLLDEALSAAAHRLVTALGGNPGAYRPLGDDAFQAAYRQRLLARGLELMHGLQPVPEEVLQRVTEVYLSPPGRWYVDRRAAAVQEMALSAEERLESLVVPTEAAGGNESVDPGMPCRGAPCGYVVEWQGRVPAEVSGPYGASADLDPRVFEHLLTAGYRVERGLSEGGLTIRIRPRTMVARCDFMSGTDNRACTAVDNVRVDFMGADEGGVRPDGFQIRNRCGADGVMGVDGISFYVATRLHHALMLAPAEKAPGPPC